MRQTEIRTGSYVRSPRIGHQAPSFVAWRSFVGLLAILVALVAAVHWPALGATAHGLDDDWYLLDNRLVQQPSVDSATRFLAEVKKPSTVPGYYHPLTMISLMIDYAIMGRTPDLRPFHRTSLALHALNAALVASLAFVLFGEVLPAALAGALFGLHPLTVEQVAWISERKTVLATFFALASLVSYVLWTHARRSAYFVLSLAAYALAVLSKPTVILLPALLVLLDGWPLRRLSAGTVWEKGPFFAVSAVSAITTLLSQNAQPHVASGYSGLQWLLAIPYSLAFYVGKILIPSGLSIFYPGSRSLDAASVGLWLHVLGAAGLGVAVWRWRRKIPAIWTMVLFYVVALVPTIGNMNFAEVAVANRYAYFPMVGLFVLAGFGLALFRRTATAPVIAAVLAVLMLEAWGTRGYIRHWKDTETLYRHLVQIAPDSASLHMNLAIELMRQGRGAEALPHAEQAARLAPHRIDAHFNLGNILSGEGRPQEALEAYNRALEIQPNLVFVHVNRGLALEALGRLDEAAAAYREALRWNPQDTIAEGNLGMTLFKQGRTDEALARLARTLRIDPRQPVARFFYAMALERKGERERAIEQYRRVLELEPDHAEARRRLQAMTTLADER